MISVREDQGEVVQGYPPAIGNNGPYVLRAPGGPQPYGQPIAHPYDAPQYGQTYGRQYAPSVYAGSVYAPSVRAPSEYMYEIVEDGYGYRPSAQRGPYVISAAKGAKGSVTLQQPNEQVRGMEKQQQFDQMEGKKGTG